MKKKPIYIALSVIYGLGFSKAKTLLKKLNINFCKKISEVSKHQITELRNNLENEKNKYEGDLRKIVKSNIRSLIRINSYRGKRHLLNLPVRGQRTRTNSRTIRRNTNLLKAK